MAHTTSTFFPLVAIDSRVKTEYECGCQVIRDSGVDKKGDYYIGLCPLHKAAPELLKALERIATGEEPKPEYPPKLYSNPLANMVQHHKKIAFAAIRNNTQ